MPTAPLPWGRILLLALVLLSAPQFTLRLSAQVIPAAADTITRFLENRGQVVDMDHYARPDILFTASAPGVRQYLRRTGISYVFYTVEYDTTLPRTPFPPEMNIPKEHLPFMEKGGDPSQGVLHGRRIDMDLIGANPNAVVERSGASSDRVNFYLPQCPDGITGLAKYATVTYRDIYPSIDLVLRGTTTGMKYDFVVHPGGDIAQIRLRYTGAEGLGETSDGGVEISSTLGNLVEGRPYSYQTALDRGSSGEKRVEIVSGYRLRGEEITFQMGEYDHSRTLVIDPVLIWGTYYGGSRYDMWQEPTWSGLVCSSNLLSGYEELQHGMAVDIDGNILIDGSTISIDFPVTQGAFQTRLILVVDAFLLAFNSDGTRRWATYIGGSSVDYSTGLGVDSLGNITVAVTTQSFNFPVTPGSHQTVYSGSSDVAIAHFSSSGRRIWATYYGSISAEHAGSLAVDRWGNIVFIGRTTSMTFPVTPGAFQTTLSGMSDCFIVKMDSSGRRLWATYLGGVAEERSSGVIFDALSNVVVTGVTYSANFPVSNGAYQSSLNNPTSNQFQFDAFLCSFDSNGNRNWATYFGGSSQDWSAGVGVDASRNIYVGGSTVSADFPTTTGSFASRVGPLSSDMYYSKFSSSGNLIWSTYYGGINCDVSSGVCVAPNGHMFVVGFTNSNDALRTTNNYQSNLRGLSDAILGEFDSFGNLIWDSYYGGSGIESGKGITGDGYGNVYISGVTNSVDLPVPRAYQPALNVNNGFVEEHVDVFVARFCNYLYLTIDADGPKSFCEGDNVTLHGPRGHDKYSWIPTRDTTRSITVLTSGVYSLYIEDAPSCHGISDSIRVVVHPLPHPVMTFGPTTICEGDSVVFRVVQSGVREYLWTNGDTTDHIVVTTAGTYAVLVTDSNGCVASTESAQVFVNPVPTHPNITPRDTVWICPDSTVQINIGAGYFRTEWNNGKVTPMIRVGEGRYWARVYNNLGCSVWSDTVVVRTYPRNKPTIKPLGSLIICPGDSVMLDAGINYVKYRWSTGDSTRIIAGRSEGIVTVTVTDTNGCQFTSDPINIIVFARALVSIIPLGKKTFCDGDSLRLDGGTGMFASYRWSTGDTTPRIAVRKSGRYKVTVTTFDGCTGGADSITVTVNPRPVALITGPTTVCVGSTQFYSVSLVAGLQYLWTVGGDGTLQGSVTTNTVKVKWGTTSPGTVTVRVTNPATGCTTTATVSVALGSELIPAVTASRLLICPGDSAQLDAGGGYTRYQWSNGATTRRIYAHPGITYTVTVDDADGCHGTSQPISISESVPPKPIVQPLGSTILCTGDSVVLDAGTGWESYLWSSGESTQQIIIRQSGSYTVSVRDTLDCRGTSVPIDVTVGLRPTPDVNGPVEVCKNSEATYSVEDHQGASYNWNVTGGVLISGQGMNQILVSWGAVGSGSVQCDETAGPSTCVGRSTALAVTIGTQLKPTITFGGKLGFCPGDSVVLDAGAGYTLYLWNTGATSRRIIVRSAGAYSVTVADAGGCSGSSGDVVVREFAPPVPTVRVLGPTTIQEGDSVALEVVELYPNYRWSTGAATRRITVKKSGDYGVTVADSNGCLGTSLGGTTITVVPRTDIDTVIAEVEVGRVSGQAGEGLRVPVYFSATNLDTTYAKGYRAELRFNRTLLLPTGATPLGVVDGTDRVINFSGPLPSGISTGGDLTRLEFIVLLGNAESTPLQLTSFELVGAPVSATITDGEFRLTGLCRNGGTRLANSDGSFGLKSVRPNPTNGICEVEYEIVESGMTRVYMVDLLGRRVAELQSGSIDPGRYVVGFDAGVVGSGTYSIILETPTQRRSGLLQVVR